MPRSRVQTLLLHLIGGIAVVATAGLYLQFDRLAAVSLDPRATALFCGLALIAAIPLLAGRRRAVQIALPIALLGALLAVQFVDWDSRKPFLRALDRVERGMTVAEVDAVMAGFIRVPAQPGGDEAIVAYRHTHTGWGDGDTALVRFAAGRVASREFFLD